MLLMNNISKWLWPKCKCFKNFNDIIQFSNFNSNVDFTFFIYVRFLIFFFILCSCVRLYFPLSWLFNKLKHEKHFIETGVPQI